MGAHPSSESAEFFQEPPTLGNQYFDDKILRNFLTRVLPREVLLDIEESLQRMGELAGGKLYELCRRHQRDEPQLIHFDPWGRRMDEIRLSPAWKELARLACEEGLVAAAYERAHGEFSRLHQFALIYLFSPSALSYSCPLAMTDGAAKTLLTIGNPELQRRIVPRLIHRDPNQAWTSGQWMTERIGGSDVGQTQTVARRSTEGWRLYGAKWFTSATTSDIALTLARPEGNPAGGKGLALFLVRQRDETGNLNGIRIHRLKNKLGTRVLPTAELTLEGALAEPVAGLTDGVRSITPMLNITRLWNAIDSAASMRRGLALARDYARKRVVFGAALSEKPLHLETLADLQTEFQSAFLFVFRAAELLGREESGKLDEGQKASLRLLLPVAKLVTARQAITAASEALECFGGAGYIEDTGLPALLRDAQVLSIWEGTTNVLALDALRAVEREDALRPYLKDVSARCAQVRDPRLLEARKSVEEWGEQIQAWYSQAREHAARESGARRFALALGRLTQLSLLLEQAQWELDHRQDGTTAAVARRFHARGLLALLSTDYAAEETRSIALQQDSDRM